MIKDKGGREQCEIRTFLMQSFSSQSLKRFIDFGLSAIVGTSLISSFKLNIVQTRWAFTMKHTTLSHCTVVYLRSFCNYVYCY